MIAKTNFFAIFGGIMYLTMNTKNLKYIPHILAVSICLLVPRIMTAGAAVTDTVPTGADGGPVR